MGRPISGKHAIEVAAFVAVFERSFSATTIEALLTLKDLLHEDYPVSSMSNVLKVKMEGSLVKPPSSSISGIFLQKLKSDSSRPAWSLRADAKTIVVSCFDYQTWEKTSPKALADLITAISVAADDQNPLEILALQVVDRFVGPSRSDYRLNQVFNTKSKFLTKQVAQSGPLWHIHQGWFQESRAFEAQHLNVLNLSTSETPHGIITTIDHAARLQLRPSKPAIEAADAKFLRAVFDNLHTCNKSIVTELLNKRQCKAIKIC